ncbi:TetR/AcrR family transcriptional regulator [Pseudooceanicola sediminis]|uniref:TetR/AcrR family transcriptional regulator n=2 Tax=Pseudooceanicola sediminis TaxID=2211117 RepID=A0A399J5K9_9RHOB|nr:TetR/AcrR family transcriptional regulator [Pseudooceanicola sediminis]KAA2317435.1 TetR/AcrR family transcriptional regulator [Puniceibacterium sp. HSS470]RII40768.1 TetR/AcrR family transcriptional regulator [Pseudooceanicola sediminis]|tara:strand:- start:251357 stop:252028 length:672 start_codon:yes stop_codon:yes gene_type:complete
MENTSDIDPEKASGWRGSRELWLDAAKRAFLENGLDAVKIQPLAAQLSISRTSFYWFFKDRNALLDALLEEWDAKNTGAFEAACSAYSESIAEAVLNLIVVFHDETLFEPQLDFAIRGWAHQSQAVMERVNIADERRLAAIRGMFERYGFPPEDADVRARTVYLVQIGYISMQVREDRAVRMSRISAYVKTFSGQIPAPNEIARFHARLGFDPKMAMTFEGDA